MRICSGNVTSRSSPTGACVPVKTTTTCGIVDVCHDLQTEKMEKLLIRRTGVLAVTVVFVVLLCCMAATY